MPEEINKYFDERIEYALSLKETIGEEKANWLVNFVITCKNHLNSDHARTKTDLKDVKKAFKDALVEVFDLKSIKDKKKRFKMLAFAYQLSDFKYDDPNSIDAIRGASKDMGMTVGEYFVSAMKFGIEMAIELADDGKGSK